MHRYIHAALAAIVVSGAMAASAAAQDGPVEVRNANTQQLCPEVDTTGTEPTGGCEVDVYTGHVSLNFGNLMCSGSTTLHVDSSGGFHAGLASLGGEFCRMSSCDSATRVSSWFVTPKAWMIGQFWENEGDVWGMLYACMKHQGGSTYHWAEENPVTIDVTQQGTNGLQFTTDGGMPVPGDPEREYNKFDGTWTQVDGLVDEITITAAN